MQSFFPFTGREQSRGLGRKARWISGRMRGRCEPEDGRVTDCSSAKKVWAAPSCCLPLSHTKSCHMLSSHTLSLVTCQVLSHAKSRHTISLATHSVLSHFLNMPQNLQMTFRTLDHRSRGILFAASGSIYLSATKVRPPQAENQPVKDLYKTVAWWGGKDSKWW